MGLRVNTNIAALNAYRNLSVTDGQMSKSLEKLSSGFRINRAADDAAGLAISEGLRCLLYTSPSPRDKRQSRMPSSA